MRRFIALLTVLTACAPSVEDACNHQVSLCFPGRLDPDNCREQARTCAALEPTGRCSPECARCVFGARTCGQALDCALPDGGC